MNGDLNPGEHHPSALDALAWVKAQGWADLCMWQEALSSCAISGNRNAELCSETLRRFMAGEGVGPQHILALAWTMRYGEIRPSKSMVKRRHVMRTGEFPTNV